MRVIQWWRAELDGIFSILFIGLSVYAM